MAFFLCARLSSLSRPCALTTCFYTTVLSMVFSFSANREITHLSSLWFIPLFGYLPCVAFKCILCVILFSFFFFFFFLGGCCVRIF